MKNSSAISIDAIYSMLFRTYKQFHNVAPKETEFLLKSRYREESHLINSCFFVMLCTNLSDLLLLCVCMNGEYLIVLYKLCFHL